MSSRYTAGVVYGTAIDFDDDKHGDSEYHFNFKKGNLRVIKCGCSDAGGTHKFIFSIEATYQTVTNDNMALIQKLEMNQPTETSQLDDALQTLREEELITDERPNKEIIDSMTWHFFLDTI